MVQRKEPNKLGNQAADHDKSEKRLGNLKPVSSQYQDGKNRGGVDLKKKMKKSGSIKLSDFESLRSSPLKQNTSLPGKPPPPPTPDAPASAAIQTKQSAIKTIVGSPNYMKATSSSDARKERNQVSPRITQTGSDDSTSPSQKNPRRSRADSSSGNKPTRTLTRSSSLKQVRILKKTPSFKYARSSAKKCSKVALCADINAQRATCSSTLKDSKFPAYLMLSPGATELEGTSVMKVCPYTYCSLNGHFHSPLPPLKCFLSAKRRSLKAQKIMKLEALSPRANASDDGRKEIYTGMVVSDGKPASQEEELGSSAICPLIRDGSMEFFIEIYARDNSAAPETSGTGIGDGDDQGKIDSTRKMEGFDDLMSSVGGVDERTEEYIDEQDAESLSDGSSCSEIDFEDNLDQNIDNILTGKDTTESCYEELLEEDADKDCPSFVAHEETPVQYSDNESDWEEEHFAMGELEKSDTDASDMEWEEGQFTTSYSAYEGDDTTQTNSKIDMDDRQVSEVSNLESLVKSLFNSDDAANNGLEEIAADEVLQEACEEESTSFEFKFGGDDSGLDATCQDSDEEFSQASDSKVDDQLSFPKDAFEGSKAAEEKDKIAETDDLCNNGVAYATTKDPNEELTTSTDEKSVVCTVEDEIINMDPQHGDDRTNCTPVLVDEAFFIDHQENELQQDDELLQEASAEENTSFEFKFGGNDSGPDGTCQDSDEEFSQASDSKVDDQLSFPNDAFEGSKAAEEKDKIAETDELCNKAVAYATTEDPTEELTTSTDDDAYGSHENQTIDYSWGFIQIDEDERYEDPIHNHKTFEEYQIDDAIETNGANEVAIDESLLPQKEDSETTPNIATSDFVLEQQLPCTELGDAMEKGDQLDDSTSLSEMHTCDPSETCFEAELENPVEDDDIESSEVIQDSQDDVNAEDCELGEHFVDGSLLSVTQDQTSDRNLESHKNVENQNHLEKVHIEAEKCKSSNSMDPEEQGGSEMHIRTLAEPSTGNVDDMEIDVNDMSDTTETCLSANTLIGGKTGNATFHARANINDEQLNTCKNLKGTIRSKRPVMDGDEARNFNPREPNYLPVNPDPEAEKVDLRHQMEDERKNAEEWMLDYALRQAVTKLAPARSRRVALLVEAFETVKPIPKYETHLRNTSAVFTRVRHLQTCI